MLTEPICTDTILAMAGGEYVSGLQLSQQLYKLLVWSSVLRVPSGYIRCPYFEIWCIFYVPFLIYLFKGLTLGSACLLLLLYVPSRISYNTLLH
jgi:hypothetical protein